MIDDLSENIERFKNECNNFDKDDDIFGKMVDFNNLLKILKTNQ